MKNIRHWLSPVLFCLLLVLGAVLLLAGPDRQYSENEKRYLSLCPVWSMEEILNGTFQEELENWVADQFPGRNLWVGIHAYANYCMGRNAQQDIYHAKNGYLINAPATNDLTLFETTVGRFDAFADKTGLPSSMILVPSTGWLKEELLPLGHGEYAEDTMFEKVGQLADHLACFDFREALLEADQLDAIAYRTDHHLTSWGNYTLYKAWRSETGKTYLPEETYQIETIDDFYGTTWSGSGYWLTEPDYVELWDSGASVTVTIADGDQEEHADSMFFRSHLHQSDKYPVFLDGNHTLTTIHNPDASEGTLLVIKDSYAHGLVPFLADHYETIYMIDLRFYRGSVSDFVLERGVDELLFLYGANTLLTDTNSAWLF